MVQFLSRELAQDAEKRIVGSILCSDADHLSVLDVLQSIDHPLSHDDLHSVLVDDPNYLLYLL